MRYITLTSKLMYYLGMSVNLFFVIFYMIMFESLIMANEFQGLIALSIFGAIWVIQFMFLNRRTIFIKIDTELEKIYFGNLFFQNECDYSQIEQIKASWIPGLYWIVIGATKYNFYVTKLDLSELVGTLRVGK